MAAAAHAGGHPAMYRLWLNPTWGTRLNLAFISGKFYFYSRAPALGRLAIIRSLSRSTLARVAWCHGARGVLIVCALAASSCRDRTPVTTSTGPLADDMPDRSPPPSHARLTDRTEGSGVNFVYDNGRAAGFHTIVESLGGGIGLFDYDNDGRYDLFCPGGGKFDAEKNPSGIPSALFRNVGDWKYVDVTAPTGSGRAPHLTHGCAMADYDGDGFADLLVTGYGGLQLFQNQGDGTFREVSQEVGMADTMWSSSAAWADYNGDQQLDVYVAHYVDWGPDDAHNPQCPGPKPEQREICSPRRFEPLPHIIYYSNGDGTFRDATSEARLVVEPHICGKGLGVVAGDLDLDGDIDIYVANDTVDNFLYLNDGHGVFEEVGLFHGVARDSNGKAEGSMGTDLGDYNLDGLPDIWVANFEQESFSLYRNDGAATFTHVSQGTGITALGRLYVGFGTVFADIDCDGDEDFVVSNGHVINYPTAAAIRQEPLLLVNDRGQRFAKAAFPPDGYFSMPHRGRGVAVSDLDNDGDLDFVFSHNDGEQNALVANDTPREGGWLRVRLIGRRSNRDAIGARLVLHTSAGDQLRLVKGGGSYESQSDLRPFWGIPAGAKVTGISIHWPSGVEQEYPLTEGNQSLTISEPPATSDEPTS
ncbi:MAG TPA: CRTAC1 family protein [Pirellulales bacterium]|nr:CRTAC1 family protein [Pirellulales bacterium]